MARLERESDAARAAGDAAALAKTLRRCAELRLQWGDALGAEGALVELGESCRRSGDERNLLRTLCDRAAVVGELLGRFVAAYAIGKECERIVSRIPDAEMDAEVRRTVRYAKLMRRYPPEAISFVKSVATNLRRRDESGDAHASGDEFCERLREAAIAEFSFAARATLELWNVRKTEDFGRIVFSMADAGLLRTSEGDREADFRNVYDFVHAFPTS